MFCYNTIHVQQVKIYDGMISPWLVCLTLITVSVNTTAWRERNVLQPKAKTDYASPETQWIQTQVINTGHCCYGCEGGGRMHRRCQYVNLSQPIFYGCWETLTLSIRWHLCRHHGTPVASYARMPTLASYWHSGLVAAMWSCILSLVCWKTPYIDFEVLLLLPSSLPHQSHNEVFHASFSIQNEGVLLA